MELFLPIALVVGLAFVGLSLRIIFVKGGEFRGTCATNNPMLKNEIGECTVCGSRPGEDCKGDPDLGQA